MEKHIKLIDAFEVLPQYGQILMAPVDYHPARSSTILNGQKAETEEFHHWYAVKFKNEVYFVSGEVSKFMLRIKAEDNETWLTEAIQYQKDYSRLYENSKLLTEGVTFNEEFLKQLPEFLQKACVNCWLTDTTEWCGHTGLFYLISHPNFDFIVPNSSSQSGVNSLLPIVKAHKNTLVALERKFDHPYTIMLP